MAVEYTADDYLQEQSWRRQHNRDRQAASKKAGALEQKAEQTVKQIVAKVLPKVASGTGVGIVISFIVLFIRGVSSNLLGSKSLPKLDVTEQVHFGILMFVVFILLVLLVILFIVMVMFAEGVIGAFKLLGTELIDFIKFIFYKVLNII